MISFILFPNLSLSKGLFSHYVPAPQGVQVWIWFEQSSDRQLQLLGYIWSCLCLALLLLAPIHSKTKNGHFIIQSVSASFSESQLPVVHSSTLRFVKQAIIYLNIVPFFFLQAYFFLHVPFVFKLFLIFWVMWIFKNKFINYIFLQLLFPLKNKSVI